MGENSTDREDVEETNSGIKKKGNWEEISKFGEDVGEVMDEAADRESVEKFDEWRPKVEESERDVKKKTVDKAVINENKLEKESDGVAEDLRQASGKVTEAGKKAAKRENPEKEIVDASEEVAKPFYSKLAKIFRMAENIIYSQIVLRFNPYYLDTEDFSADIKHRKKGEFQMDVSVPEEEPRRKLKEEFREDNG